MIVDLNSLELDIAKEVIMWCIRNHIDADHANKLIFAWYYASPMFDGTMYGKPLKWKLNIPEEYVPYIALKFL